MLERLRQLLIKEFLQLLRDRRARLVLIVPPLLQMLIFGYAANYEIRHVSLAVLDQDNTSESRELVSRFAATPYFNIVRRLDRHAQIGETIDRGQATVALEIDAGFARRLNQGETAQVAAIVDATNSNTALLAAGYLARIASNYAAEVHRANLARLAPQLAHVVPSVELETRPWYNVDLRSRWFFVPGVIGSLTMIIVIVLTAFAVVREREIGTLEQIMVTPIRPFEFILGKTLPFFLIGLADVALIGTAGTLWFRVPLRGSLAVLASGTVLFLLCMLGLGLLISTVSRTQQQALVTAFFYMMPAIVFSGFGFPISTMPHWLQQLTYLTPLRYYLIVLRGVYLKGVGYAILWPQFAGMALLAVVLLTTSVLRFHKALD